jgi:hypothetical protein
MKKQGTRRNYRVVGLVPDGDVYAVEIRKADGTFALDSSPSEFGTWGLDARERAIVRRGLTSAGRDRNPKNERRKS